MNGRCDRCGERKATKFVTDYDEGLFEYCELCFEGDSGEPEEERDPAYERAAARYDGTGRDWR